MKLLEDHTKNLKCLFILLTLHTIIFGLHVLYVGDFIR